MIQNRAYDVAAASAADALDVWQGISALPTAEAYLWLYDLLHTTTWPMWSLRTTGG
jgi:hypothetical protein